MRRLFGAMVAMSLAVLSADAAPRTVLVLPLDGNIDGAERARLNAAIARLARQLPGDVTIGDTTFEETAAAVGCEASTPACAESVRSTLGVDELVTTRATSSGGKTTVVIRRVRARTTATHATATVSADVASSDNTTRTDAALAPLFDAGARPPPDAAPTPRPAPPARPLTRPPTTGGEPAPPPPALAPRLDTPAQRDEPARPARTRGIIMLSGGGVLMLTGIVLWVDVARDQNAIDDATPDDADDFRALEDREDSAQRKALVGDVLFVAGLGIAAWGGITIYRDDQAREVTLSPQVTTGASASTAGLLLGGRW